MSAGRVNVPVYTGYWWHLTDNGDYAKGSRIVGMKPETGNQTRSVERAKKVLWS